MIKEYNPRTLTDEDNQKDLIEFTNEEEMVELTSALMDDVIETPYTSKRIISIGKRYELETKEIQEISKIIKDYSIKPKSIEKFLGAGIQVNEIESFVNLYKEVNEGEIYFTFKKLEPLNPSEETYYFVSNAANYISYDNLLFVQKLINGNPSQIEDALYSISSIDQEEGGFGIGIILNRMRNLYESSDRYHNLSLEGLVYASINKIPFRTF